jgi:Na+/citrate or Na+/malate symporter
MGPGLNSNLQAADGPGINLIPATPVSGGGNGATAAPFSQVFNQINDTQSAQIAGEFGFLI